MSRGFVDSASLYQIIQCLDTAYADQYPWSLQTAVNLTTILIGTDHQHIAPGLRGRPGFVVDEYDRFVDQLISKGLVQPIDFLTGDEQDVATTKTKQWAGRESNISKLRSTAEQLLADKINFAPWIEWSSTKAWHSHSARLGGLFDVTFLPYVARVLDITESEAADLQRRSRDSKHLDDLIQKRQGSRAKDFELMTKAYMVSSLLRGKYHYEVAKIASLQILHHPFREFICSGGTRDQAQFDVSNTSEALARIIVYGAARQQTLRDRLDCWIDNLLRVKPLVASGRARLNQAETNHAAVDVATEIAKKAKIEMGRRRIVPVMEFFVSLGVAVLASITLSRWLSIPAAATTDVATRKLRLLEKVRGAFLLRGRKLRDLGAGRIRCGWKQPKD